MNTKNKTGHANKNAQFHAAFDNDNLPAGKVALKEALLAAERRKHAVHPDLIDVLLNCDGETYSPVVHTGNKAMDVIAYSTANDPLNGDLAMILISRCCKTHELILTITCSMFSPFVKACVLEDNLVTKSFLRYLMDEVTAENRESVPMECASELYIGKARPALSIYATPVEGLEVHRMSNDGPDTWTVYLPQGSNRTLRTVNPAEGR